MSPRAFALAAHPDDIEFQMAGTLILLRQAGYEIHYMNVANGSCGTSSMPKSEIINIRREESTSAARSIGAIYHDSLVDDLAIYYEEKLLSRISAIMREVSPEILLLQSPHDYMEDHQNTARLGATAAFSMGMPNFKTQPSTKSVDQQVAIYHAQPHGNRDILRQKVRPDFYVDISTVLDQKTDMLACHASQGSWLDKSQEMDSYLNTMTEMSAEVAKMSGFLEYAEGWRKRLHFGYAPETFNPLEEALGSFVHESQEHSV